MLEFQEMAKEVLYGAINYGSEAYQLVQSNPTVIAAQPAIGAVGSVLGGIAGYEIGHSLALKERGLWHASLSRPLLLLVGTIALAVLGGPQAALAIGATTVGTFVLGLFKAQFDKPSVDGMTFKELQENYGVKPDNINLVEPKDFLNIQNPTREEVSGLVWSLTKTACDNGDSFERGTFVLEGVEVEDLYNKLQNVDGSYTRPSSHFKGRIADGKDQMGIDFNGDDEKLPVGKRTILFGLADTHDKKKVLFIKPESWGADHNISSWSKARHFINHSLEFVHAQYVKAMRPGYDDRPGSAKERIPHSWKNEAKTAFGWAQLSDKQKQNLVDSNLAKDSWLNDTYRTGREAYIKINDKSA